MGNKKPLPVILDIQIILAKNRCSCWRLCSAIAFPRHAWNCCDIPTVWVDLYLIITEQAHIELGYRCLRSPWKVLVLELTGIPDGGFKVACISDIEVVDGMSRVFRIELTSLCFEVAAVYACMQYVRDTGMVNLWNHYSSKFSRTCTTLWVLRSILRESLGFEAGILKALLRVLM